MASQGKVALVAGGSGNIGRAVALTLAEQGADVALAGRSRDKLDNVARGIRDQTGKRIISCPCDLTRPQAAASLVSELVGNLGRLDILVTCAGDFKHGDLLAVSSEDWMHGFSAMFFGAVRLITAAWPHLKASRGHVVTVSGIFALEPSPDAVIPGSIAAALLNFTKAIAGQGRRDQVSVNCVLPGPILGHRLEQRLDRLARERGVSREDAQSAYTRELGMPRLGRPEDVAALVGFLVSEQAELIRGASIVIDGGSSRII